MRQALFAVVLVAASFAGGAVVNGPGLRWAQAMVWNRAGLGAEGTEAPAPTPPVAAKAEDRPASEAPLASQDAPRHATEKPRAPEPTAPTPPEAPPAVPPPAPAR